MTSENYILLNKYIKNHPKIEKAVIFVDMQFPKPVMWIFYGTLLLLAVRLDKRVFAFGAVPWIDFFIVTKIRNRINRRRPFEKYGFEPVVPHSPGKSCPSRHASSSVIITIAVFFTSPVLGVITGIISLFVCVSRILTGVHYISDVIFGAIISFIIGAAAFLTPFKL